MTMICEISQSDDLTRKTKRRWEELPKLMELIFLAFFLCVLYFCPCVSRMLSLPSLQTADFSAMHHGTINR